MNTQEKPRVKMDEIGLYLRTIRADYKPETTQEMADLITQFFNVLCLPEDIEHYETLFYEGLKQQEDLELESRRHEYFSKLNRSNPFY
jgi:hypothetical protein